MIAQSEGEWWWCWWGWYGDNVDGLVSSSRNSYRRQAIALRRGGWRLCTSRSVQNYFQPRQPPAKTARRPLQHTCNALSNLLRTDASHADMKLNVKNIRYVTPEDWRVLTAVCAPVVARRRGGGLTLMEMHTD